MYEYNPIAESNNFIVLDKYEKYASCVRETRTYQYQTEADLENEFIQDLRSQGYEYLSDLKTPEAMFENARVQLQILNDVQFTDSEWTRFCEEYLDKAGDNHIDKTRKIHNNYIYDFVFDDGHIKNIYLVKKEEKDIAKNKVQVISQFEQTGIQDNRYDVTILVNGLPMIQVELKKRGVAIREAFNQINRYSKESFNSENSLYKYLQMFVISNGTDTRYFVNTTRRDKDSFDFTMNWAKEFLAYAIDEYNKMFQTTFGVESKEFQNYYRDLSNRVKNREVDLLIVVGMFLTGFDAPTLNTLFVDKNLRYHGLMQAFSRTNRIYDSTKTFGNIVTFRNLEQATIDAIKCFGDDNTRNIVLEKSYKEYMEGFKDLATGEICRGYVEVVKELSSRFADVDEILTEKDKKEFVKLFGEYLRIENILQNYDEFTCLKELQRVDLSNPEAVKEFKAAYFVSDEDIKAMQSIDVLAERTIQDYRSAYNDIREWISREKEGRDKENSKIDWDDVVFEVDLLKSQEINLDYILELIFEKNQNIKDKSALVEEMRRITRSSAENRAKESLIVDFINQTPLDEIKDKASVLDAFYQFAQKEQKKEAEELIREEHLNEEAAKRYILASLKKEYASENGTGLNEALPKMSPLNPKYHTKKQSVLEKISAFVEKFKRIGGAI